MAAFYRLVGGDYDALFLETPHASLSFIYTSLGCYHSLEPDLDPYKAPSVPALTPQGFVKWQTIQLLLDPPLHVPLLQEALKRFEIINPGGDGPFPKILPSSALPGRVDREMYEWHENALQKLLPSPEPLEERQATEEVESLTDSSFDDSSIVDAGDYFEPRHERRSSPQPRVVPISPKFRKSDEWRTNGRPSYHESRRRSHPDEYTDRDDPWDADGLTPTGFTGSRSRRTARQRASSSDATNRESFSTSEASLSPPRHREEAQLYPPSQRYARRHSAHNVHGARAYKLPQMQTHSHSLSPPFFTHQRPHSQARVFEETLLPSRNANIRWQSVGGPAKPLYRSPSTHSGERPGVRFVKPDEVFREGRTRRKSMEPVGESDKHRDS